MTDRTHWPDCWKDPAHHACALTRINNLEVQLDSWNGALEDASSEKCPDAEAQHCGCVAPLRHEIARLRMVLRMTHTQYCTESWTDRGLHAPGCLLYELEPKE